MVKVKRINQQISLMDDWNRGGAHFKALYEVEGRDGRLFIESWAPPKLADDPEVVAMFWQWLDDDAQWIADHRGKATTVQFTWV